MIRLVYIAITTEIKTIDYQKKRARTIPILEGRII